MIGPRLWITPQARCLSVHKQKRLIRKGAAKPSRYGTEVQVEQVKLEQCGCGHEPACMVDQVMDVVDGSLWCRAQVNCTQCFERGPLRMGVTKTVAAISAAIAWNDRRREEIRRRA